MKILIFNWRDIQNPSSGGAEILTQEIAKYWVKQGNEVTQFSSRFPQSLPEEVIDGVKIIRAGYPDTRKLFKSVHFLAFWYYQKKFKGKVDVVVDEVHGLPFFTPWYIKEKKVVLICEVAGKLWFEMFGPIFGSAGWIVEKLYLRLAYRNVPCLTISKSTKEELGRNGMKERNITVLPMGVTVSAKGSRTKKEKEPTLIFVGRLSKSKGIEDVILALKKIQISHSNTKLWIIGRGDNSYVDTLKMISKKLGVKDKISFLGFVSEKEKFNFLSRAWVLVHPSKTEGWGINVIEANTVGTPAVGYNVSGLRDSIQNKKTGLLTLSNTPDSLADAVIQLIDNKDLYKFITINAINWSKNFSWKTAGEESLRVIKKIYEQ